MVLSDFTGALIRRWYVVLVGLLGTVALMFAATSLSAPVYKARGLVVLMPSQDSVGLGGNPFLGLGGLELPARVVVAYFSSASVQQQVAEVSPQATATVSMEESTKGPVIAIDVAAPSSNEAIGVLGFINKSIPAALDRIQQQVGAPKNTDVRAVPLVMDQRALPDTKAALRLTILAGGLGLVGTGFLTFALDGIVRRRKDLKASASAAESEPASPQAPADITTAIRTEGRRAPRSPQRGTADGQDDVAEIATLRDAHRPARLEKAARKRG